ncbi:MAG: aminotransferase class I/II-fold pyridoxal phosphate-dependent enzyme [Verrucomicrobia bacterium]|nr:aminotransferase class I/II-fold pyridoxal phosphate-dependent enzyme [Verrucomicrobiota bacterium]MDA1086966.1 aminotransferase class I/II-fold pyridoxal phosphate-dependent enzyme [Verrucomicrobiota bacterium]
MLRVGKEEADAVRRVIESGDIFRYNVDGECGRSERRLSEFTGATYAVQCSSGTNAITAGLIGLEIGPGDEVIVPAHTFMASAMTVLAVGAIPIIVNVDESIMIDPRAVEEAIGPCTRGDARSKDMCSRSLDILARTVLVGIRPDHSEADIQALAEKINRAAEQVLTSSV